MLALGDLPVADRLSTGDGPAECDPTARLEVVRCTACGLVQLRETVAPEILFDAEYPYFSSVSETVLENARNNAAELITDRGLGPDSLVVEIASNDGYLLRNFVAAGVPVLGIDPSAAPVSDAVRAGIPTLETFFDADLARRLAADGRRADVVIANNVLAHVPDPNDFVRGIATILRPGGIAVLEFPHLLDLLDRREFDTIYHQHVSYFSFAAVDRLLERHGLRVRDARRLPIHGGSLRVYADRGDAPGPTRDRLLALEAERGLDGPAPYAHFRRDVERIRAELVGLLRSLKMDGARIAAYGAAAKGTTLLGYCGIGRELIDYVVDRNGFKQGRFMPGNRLPILPPGTLLEDRPEYVLLLAWNLAEEIVAQQTEYLTGGGRFVVPIPRPTVL